MTPTRETADRTGPALAAHLLGTVDFDSCLALQQRLVYECGGARESALTLLVCEHPATITIGRHGSRGHVHFDEAELTSRRIATRWVNRGGGAILHVPGQLAVYPIVPLERLGWNAGAFLDRLERALAAALAEAGVSALLRPGRRGLWGRSGQISFCGVAVKQGVSYFGAYVNVCPDLRLLRYVDSDPTEHTAAGSLLAERQQPVRMAGVRERVIRHLATAMSAGRTHLHTGHPWLARRVPPQRDSAIRAR